MNYIAIANDAHVFEPTIFRAEDITDARHWVINHLDCSKTWHILHISTRYVNLLDPTKK